jgi:polyisoprenyl-phosphate glycosyltransferase
MPKISVIVPVYFNELNLPPLMERLLALSKDKEFEFEYIFVDDGSGDNSYSVLKELAAKDNRVKVIKLSRNFGSFVASLAGIRNATGDCLTVISSDLQDPPELILEMAQEWKSGRKVVLAVREDRKDSLMVKLTAFLFYWLMKKFILSDMPSGGFDFFLIDKKVAQIVSRSQEKNTSLIGLILWLGFDRKIIYYTRQKREVGKSMWTFRKKSKYFIDSITAFSYWPLRLASIFGIVISLGGFFYIGWIFYMYFFMVVPPPGWSALMVIVLFVSGIQLIMLGVIGEYLWRNFDETKKRPVYVVDETQGIDDPR